VGDNKHTTILFGFVAGTLESISSEVSMALGVKFHLHDSQFRGGDYYRFESGRELYILQRNNDGGSPDERAEEEFGNYPILLYIETQESGTAFIDRLRRVTSAPVMLRFSEQGNT
jgi:hypothetical protein